VWRGAGIRKRELAGGDGGKPACPFLESKLVQNPLGGGTAALSQGVCSEAGGFLIWAHEKKETLKKEWEHHEKKRRKGSLGLLGGVQSKKHLVFETLIAVRGGGISGEARVAEQVLCGRRPPSVPT